MLHGIQHRKIRLSRVVTPTFVFTTVCSKAQSVDKQLLDDLEVLAEDIASRLLADKRIIRLRIRLEKPEAIAEAAGVGVEIERLSRRKPLISQTENA